MQLQKNISKIFILSAVFLLSCSAAPSPRDISISIHIDDLDQQTRGDIHTRDEFNSTLDVSNERLHPTTQANQTKPHSSMIWLVPLETTVAYNGPTISNSCKTRLLLAHRQTSYS